MRIFLVLLAAWGVAGSTWAVPLRVVSLNVQLGLGNATSSGFSLTARDLERIGADLVALQELQSDYQNIQALGSRLGLPYFSAIDDTNQTVGILSRYPLRSTERISTGGPRRVLLVQPDLPNLQDDPWIAVVHLKCCGDPGGPEQQTRAAELYNLRSALLARGISSLSRVVILGDFNLVSDVDASYGTWPTFAPASADGYFPDEGIFKLPLRHVDGINSFTWLGSSQFQPRDMDHIMLSGPLRDRNPAHEIYEPRKDSKFPGRPKFGDAPATNASYAADHLPIFADLVVRDTGDGFSADTNPPTLVLGIASQALTFVNRSVTSAATDVTAMDDQDPAPVVTVYPLNPTFTSAGTRKITYMARDRMGNIRTVDRSVTVAAWGTNGITHNLQWPPAMQIPVNGQGTVYAQIYIPGWTETVAKVAPNVRCWIGVHSQNSDPSTWPASAWKEASLNGSQGVGTNADEYMLSLQAGDTGPGSFYYAARWQINGGAYGYGGVAAGGGGGAWNGTVNTAGVLTVGSTVGTWSSNAPVTSELVGKYAIGGAASVLAAAEPPVMAVEGNTLSLTATVRKDDPKLAVGAEWATDLALGWSTNGINSATNGLVQPEDPGLERRKFMVSYDPANEPRKFLRLKATLAP